MRMQTLTCLTIGVIGLFAAAPVRGAGELKVGVGKVVITPKQDMWLAGLQLSFRFAFASPAPPQLGKRFCFLRKRVRQQAMGSLLISS